MKEYTEVPIVDSMSLEVDDVHDLSKVLYSGKTLKAKIKDIDGEVLDCEFYFYTKKEIEEDGNIWTVKIDNKTTR